MIGNSLTHPDVSSQETTSVKTRVAMPTFVPKHQSITNNMGSIESGLPMSCAMATSRSVAKAPPVMITPSAFDTVKQGNGASQVSLADTGELAHCFGFEEGAKTIGAHFMEDGRSILLGYPGNRFHEDSSSAKEESKVNRVNQWYDSEGIQSSDATISTTGTQHQELWNGNSSKFATLQRQNHSPLSTSQQNLLLSMVKEISTPVNNPGIAQDLEMKDVAGVDMAKL